MLHTIQLVALAKTTVIQSYGIDKILEPFMQSIKKLENVRHIYSTNRLATACMLNCSVPFRHNLHSF